MKTVWAAPIIEYSVEFCLSPTSSSRRTFANWTVHFRVTRSCWSIRRNVSQCTQFEILPLHLKWARPFIYECSEFSRYLLSLTYIKQEWCQSGELFLSQAYGSWTRAIAGYLCHCESQNLTLISCLSQQHVAGWLSSIHQISHMSADEREQPRIWNLVVRPTFMKTDIHRSLIEVVDVKDAWNSFW